MTVVVAVAVVVALAVSLVLTGVLSSVRSRLAILDHPNERSLHDAPTPRTGGLAIMCGIGVSAAVAILLAGVPPPWVGWTLASAAVTATISFCDDRWSLPPLVRLIGQVLVVSVLVERAGIVLAAVPIPWIGVIDLGPARWPITILFIAWMANLYNFMDGMDGLAGGMALVGFGVVASLALAAGDLWLGLLAITVASAAAGFLPFNLPAARIFMGDVGSVPLGLLAGALTVRAVHARVFDIWVPLLAFSPFIVDATIVVVRRSLRGEAIWLAHRQHCYQRLVLAGWTQQRTLMAEYALAAAASISALVYAYSHDVVRSALLVGWSVMYAALYRAVMIIEDHRQNDSVHSPRPSW